MKNKSIYIGDGVYVSFDGYHVWLALNHHEHKVIALNPVVWANLVRFVDSIPHTLAEVEVKKDD